MIRKTYMLIRISKWGEDEHAHMFSMNEIGRAHV